MRAAISAFVATLLSANTAIAACLPPAALPKPPSPAERPAAPSCLTDNNAANDCEASVLDKYSEDVQAYIKKLDDYVFASEQYADDAGKFARCEADEVRETLSD